MKTKEELNALKEKSEDQKWKKVRKLTDEELEKVAGGRICHISCSNPECAYYRSKFFAVSGTYCPKCGSEMVWVAEGFYVPD